MENMEKCKLKQSEFDPCLFIQEKFIFIFYVDDLLFWEKYEVDTTQVLLTLHHKEVNIKKQYVSVFLWVKLKIDADSGFINIFQGVLIEIIIS